MKIGIDGRAASLYRGTGIGTYTYELLNALSSIDDFYRYVIFMRDMDKLDIDFGNNFFNSFYDFPIEKNFWDTINYSPSISKNILDIYHNPQNGIGLPIKKNCPYVITLHDIIPLKMPETVSDKYLKIFSQNLDFILKNADGIITVSNFSKDDIAKTLNYPKEKIFVTHLASQKIYAPIDKDEAKRFLHKKYKISGKYILNVGGFSPRKNILGLLDAFSKVLEVYHNDLSLIIVGNHGKSYSLYKERAEKLNISSKVLFPGFIPVDDLNYFYNGAEAFVYPSFYEGFGLPPIESMSCGTPVVCSNTTSLPEVVLDASLSINPYDIDELSCAIIKVLSDKSLREKLILKGIVRSNKLNWHTTARKTLRAYNSIIQGKKSD